MDQLIIALDERLANPGDALVLNGTVNVASYALGDHVFALIDGLTYDVMLTNAGEGILATGIVKATAKGSCDRCLDDAYLDLSGEVNEYFLYKEPSQDELGDDDDEVDFSLINSDNTIDLMDALMQAIMMETPFVVLCQDDCKGLCPMCGENLNHVDCGHAQIIAQKQEEERLQTSPFAALADLDFDKKDE